LRGFFAQRDQGKSFPEFAAAFYVSVALCRPNAARSILRYRRHILKDRQQVGIHLNTDRLTQDFNLQNQTVHLQSAFHYAPHTLQRP
jgi:hypothetical protein